MAHLITPIGDDEPFDINQVHEAARLAKTDPAAITDMMLRHVATLDPSQVDVLIRKRAEALKLKVFTAAPRTAPAATASSSTKTVETATILAGIKPHVMTMIEHARRDLESAVAAARAQRVIEHVRRDVAALRIGQSALAELRKAVDADRDRQDADIPQWRRA